MFISFIAFMVATATCTMGSPIPAPDGKNTQLRSHSASCTEQRTQLDTSILQFALSLELLENAFYSGGLAKYDEDDFANAGFESWVRGRFEQIAAHEAEHVAFLQAALGSSAPQACTYSLYVLSNNHII